MYRNIQFVCYLGRVEIIFYRFIVLVFLHITQVLLLNFLTLYIYSEIYIFHIKYFSLPYPIDVVLTLSNYFSTHVSRRGVRESFYLHQWLSIFHPSQKIVTLRVIFINVVYSWGTLIRFIVIIKDGSVATVANTQINYAFFNVKGRNVIRFCSCPHSPSTSLCSAGEHVIVVLNTLELVCNVI